MDSTRFDSYATTIRSMVEEENNLQNNRLTWLMTIQGLLFAALGFAWDKAHARILVCVLCVLAILVSLSSWSALQLSGAAYQELKSWWDKFVPENYDGPPIMGSTAQPKSYLHWILRPWRLLPWIFIIAWVFIFIFNVRRA